MDTDILRGLVECLPDPKEEEALAKQGEAWADIELNTPHAILVSPPNDGTLKWEVIRAASVV